MVWNNKGYTLYLVLVTVAVAGILFTISLNASASAHLVSIRQSQRLQAKLLAQSGIARAEYFLNGGDGHNLYWETDGFKESINKYGEISLLCNRFGGFARVISEGRRLKKKYTLQGLMYRDVPKNISPVLTLTGHVGGLVLDYTTSLSGTVVIHHGKVTRGKRRDPIPGSTAWTTLRESPAFPFAIEPLKTTIRVLENSLQRSGSTAHQVSGNYSIVKQHDSLLLQKSVVVTGNCTIGAVEIGSMEIVATGTITLDQGCRCNGTTFIAEKIEVMGGTTMDCLFFSRKKQTLNKGAHRSQFFATDSIIVKPEARFTHPVCWVCHRKLIADTALTGGIYFAEHSAITGQVICFADTTKTGKTPYAGPSVVLGKKSVVKGCIITNGDIDMNTIDLTGHIWARSLSTKKDDVIYGNWLFGCSLKPNTEEMPFPLVGELPAKVQVLEN